MTHNIIYTVLLALYLGLPLYFFFEPWMVTTKVVKGGLDTRLWHYYVSLIKFVNLRLHATEMIVLQLEHVG